MNNGINIRVSGWHTVDFEENVYLVEGSIIILRDSLRKAIISLESVIKKITLISVQSVTPAA
jgi:hypothetical protein